MTILPKKKHQEAKKSDVEFDEGRNRGRNRTTRDRARPTSGELSGSTECSANVSHGTTSPRYEFNEVEKRESSDCSSVPYKRTRHRPVAGSGKFQMGTNDGGRGTSSTRRLQENDGDEEEYNSSDEHGPLEVDPDIAKKEEDFEKELREKKGFTIKKMVPDGACLFRAVADQVYGDQEMHSIVRNHCMDYMMKNSEFFSKFITEDFTSYIHRKKNDYCHGNNVEMQALSEMYNRPIEVYVYSLEPINTFISQSHRSSDDNPAIRLSYHGNVHYNSLVNPYAPTVGVGLGLAGYKPGFADRMLMNTVIRKSEEQVLEEEMLKDKLKATDWEATDETLTEIVARESYLQWLKESQRKHRASACQTGSSATSSSSSSQGKKSPPHEHSSPRPCASGYSPLSPRPAKTNNSHHSSPMSSPNRIDDIGPAQHNTRLPPSRSKECATGDGAAAWEYPANISQDQEFSGWDDDRIIAAVLAKSQTEYYHQLSNSSANRNMEK